MQKRKDNNLSEIVRIDPGNRKVASSTLVIVMESSSSAAGTGSAGASSSASSSRTPTRKRKRKDNIVAAVKEDDTLDQMRARVKAARKKKHNVKTISGNVKRVAAIITWLVLHSLTQVLTPQSHHEHSVKVGSTSYFSSTKNVSELINLLLDFDSILSNYRRMGVK